MTTTTKAIIQLNTAQVSRVLRGGEDPLFPALRVLEQNTRSINSSLFLDVCIKGSNCVDERRRRH